MFGVNRSMVQGLQCGRVLMVDLEDVGHVLLSNNLVCPLLAFGVKVAILEVVAGKAVLLPQAYRLSKTTIGKRGRGSCAPGSGQAPWRCDCKFHVWKVHIPNRSLPCCTVSRFPLVRCSLNRKS